jgi:hypothetical protein
VRTFLPGATRINLSQVPTSASRALVTRTDHFVELGESVLADPVTVPVEA